MAQNLSTSSAPIYIGSSYITGSRSSYSLLNSQNFIVSVPSGAYAVLPANSGALHIMAQTTAAQAVTLPTLAAGKGCTFKFIWTAQADGVHTSVFDTVATNQIWGTITNNVAAAVLSISKAGGTVTRSATAANTGIGDYLEFFCDGTHYYVKGTGTCGPAGAGAATFS